VRHLIRAEHAQVVVDHHARHLHQRWPRARQHRRRKRIGFGSDRCCPSNDGQAVERWGEPRRGHDASPTVTATAYSPGNASGVVETTRRASNTSCCRPSGSSTTDDDDDRVRRAYRERLEAIADRLTPELRVLANDVVVHDSIIEVVRWWPEAKKLVVQLVTTHPVTNVCSTVTLTYHGALLGRGRIETLRLVANDRATQVLNHEVDIDDDGLVVHRLLFWPRDEVTIDCTTLDVSIAERDTPHVLLGPAFIEFEADS
jgi:hypothetical protein